MNIEVNSLRKVYKQYGYREVAGSSSVKVFLYEQGRYFGADIIPLDNSDATSDECKRLKNDYSEGGYAVQIKKYENNAAAELELYKGFFSHEITAKRIQNKYNDFIKAQVKLNGGHRYEYINSPFHINNEFSGNRDIMDPIIAVLKKNSPQLVIVEASAGYGKTCTAYEILKMLLDSDFCENPLMTELSRNRGANIFRYILLDEIDHVYPTLDSHLVNHEIKTGRIPLIIDGFDELLHKSDIVKSDKEDVFGEVETMLDTIGNLLKGNSKIILTTRKTALFAGEDFQKWLTKWDNEFEATRFSIEIPRIKDWLTQPRLDLIRDAQLPVENIANPVLLTYLRNLTENDFLNHISEPDSIVKKYFHSLHEREMKRQDLRISPDDQYKIFKNVVKLMIKFDQTSDKKSFIREIIMDQNVDILEKALTLYSGEQTISLLADKLVNHALLDRKGPSEDAVGFINDFVFGTFIGEIMSESSSSEIESFSAYMIEIGVTAYKVQARTNKHLLWNKIEALSYKFESSVLFFFDIILKNNIERDFKDTIFQSLHIFNISFQEKKISSSVFINCRFKNCSFKPEVFEFVSFIECFFEDCKVEGGIHIDDRNEIYTIKCTQKGSEVLDYSDNTFIEARAIIIEEKIETELLKELYNIENQHKSQRLIHLMKKHKKTDHKMLARILEGLEKQHIIKICGLDVFIEVNKLQAVKKRISIK